MVPFAPHGVGIGQEINSFLLLRKIVRQILTDQMFREKVH
jgi:hypothetical protein